MVDEQTTAVTLNDSFYRDSYFKVLFVLLLSIVINFGLGSTILYILLNPPKPRYFATSINGRITPLFPLDKANQNISAVSQWANEAVQAAFTYNFINYKQELKAASGYFTNEGWNQFIQFLTDTGNLEVVRQQKLIVSAQATRAPMILRKGPQGGKYAWRLEIPIQVTYQNASFIRQTQMTVKLLITRVSSLNSVRGIGIAQFIIRNSSSDETAA